MEHNNSKESTTPLHEKDGLLLLSALSDEISIRIIDIIASSAEPLSIDETAQALQENIHTKNVGERMKKLRNVGILSAQKRGTLLLHSYNPERAAVVLESIAAQLRSLLKK